MKNKEQIEAYKKMAKEAASVGMEAQIKANLEKTCDKYKGHEDKLPGCISYLTSVAKEILGGKNGEVDDNVCFRICRDYFNDELWEKDEKKTAKKAAQEPDLEMTEQTPDPEPETPAEREETKPAPKPEPGQCSLFDLAGFANA